MANFLTRIFGSRNQRLLRQYSTVVDKINALEEELQSLSDEQLRAKTDEFKSRVKAGETLQDVLAEAFAVAREASVRTMGKEELRICRQPATPWVEHWRSWPATSANRAPE